MLALELGGGSSLLFSLTHERLMSLDAILLLFTELLTFELGCRLRCGGTLPRNCGSQSVLFLCGGSCLGDYPRLCRWFRNYSCLWRGRYASLALQAPESEPRTLLGLRWLRDERLPTIDMRGKE